MARPGWSLQAGLRARHYALLLVVALVMFLPGQSRLPPVDRDESRYAQSVTQMLETGDFINIHFQGNTRYLQPAGIYWLQAASVSLLSRPQARAIWAHRVPSLLAACAAVLLTAYVGSVLFGPATGFGAALMMAFCVLLGFEARMAKIDASLLAVTLLAQAMLARVWMMRGRAMPHPRLTAALFWAALGVGLMLKGPIILLVVGTTVVGAGLTSREWAWLKRLHAGWGVLITLAIALPWLIAIGVISHGAFFSKAVGHNMGDKLRGGEQGHGQPPGYYLALFSATFWPGALALVMALPWAWRERRSDAVRFCTWWVLPTWLVFELIPTKLPHYVLPLYPALAALAGAAALDPQGWARPRGWRWLGVAYGVLWLALGLALACLGPLALARIQRASDPLAAALGAGAALAVLIATALLLWRRRGWALGAVGVGAALAATDIYAVAAPELTSVFVSPRIAAEARRIAPCGAATVFASSAYSEPSLVFLTRTETALVAPAKAADFVAADRRCRLALVGAGQFPVFAAEAARDGFTPRPVGGVEGRNYSTGKRLDLTFYAGSPGKIGPPPPP